MKEQASTFGGLPSGGFTCLWEQDGRVRQFTHRPGELLYDSFISAGSRQLASHLDLDTFTDRSQGVLHTATPPAGLHICYTTGVDYWDHFTGEAVGASKHCCAVKYPCRRCHE